MKLRFLQCFPCENPRFGSLKRRYVDSEIDKKMTWKQARNKQKRNFENSKLIYTGPEITPKSNKRL